jgi:hypothetical protein
MISGLYAAELADEMFRLLSDRAGWPATLFRQSTIGLMEEFVVSGVYVANGILSPASFADLKAQVHNQVLNDPGLGSMRIRGPLLSQFPGDSKEFVPSSFKHKAWMSAIPHFTVNYLANWRQELVGQGYGDDSSPLFAGAVSPYDAACFLVSHLLHLCISNSYLSRWLDYRILHDPSPYELGDLLLGIEAIVNKGRGHAEILAGLARPPQDEVRSMRNWLDATAAREWLSRHGLQGPRTLHGGILYKSEQWDLDGALLNVAKAIHRLRQRTMLKTGKAPEFYGTAWIAGVRTPKPLPGVSQLGRALAPGYELGDTQVDAPASGDRLEVAIELLQAALAEPGPSAAGTLWAAMEGLLAAPGDPDRVQVCQRAADIGLIALIRSSIHISIGALFSRCSEEAFAQRISGLERRDRLVEFEKALRRDEHQTLSHRSSRLMMSHARRLFGAAALRSQRKELEQVLRGLYRQRNLVLHGGITDAPLLDDLLRSSTPLVAAVINRYARATQDGMVDPHVFAYDVFVRLEEYLSDPQSIMDAFW